MYEKRFGSIVRTILYDKAGCGLDVSLKADFDPRLSAPQLFKRFGSPQKPVSEAENVASVLSLAQKGSKTTGIRFQSG